MRMSLVEVLREGGDAAAQGREQVDANDAGIARQHLDARPDGVVGVAGSGILALLAAHVALLPPVRRAARDAPPLAIPEKELADAARPLWRSGVDDALVHKLPALHRVGAFRLRVLPAPHREDRRGWTVPVCLGPQEDGDVRVLLGGAAGPGVDCPRSPHQVGLRGLVVRLREDDAAPSAQRGAQPVADYPLGSVQPAVYEQMLLVVCVRREVTVGLGQLRVDAVQPLVMAAAAADDDRLPEEGADDRFVRQLLGETVRGAAAHEPRPGGLEGQGLLVVPALDKGQRLGTPEAGHDLPPRG
mmetsp:Transcript_55158/g.164201  ORF Transcript_55158/g.164201 Transcript_55158/m.164201 type:complete len:301 (-) Transcript_55158:40-942(-)